MKRFRRVVFFAGGLFLFPYFSLAQTASQASAKTVEFKPLNIAHLRANAKKFHRMARNLRARFKLRSQKVSALDQQVQQVIAQQKNIAMQQQAQAQQQQAQAQSNAAVLNGAASFLGGFVPGGNSFMGKAVQGGLSAAGQSQVKAAQQNAVNGGIQVSADQEQSQAQANALTAEEQRQKDKLARLTRRADQFDRMADAEDLLADSEELRLSVDKMANRPTVKLEIKKERDILSRIDVW